MAHAHANPIITDYSKVSDDVACAIDCANGVCTDDPRDKMQSLLNVHSYLGQLYLSGPPCPGPCPPPCSAKELEAFHKLRGVKAGGFDPTQLLAFIQLIWSLIQSLINPTPTPTLAASGGKP